ncbi:MAG: helix-turn-helix transcriptional regulator [Candidatus Poribacteria bacterium]|nr:helix-turn-helix transcriptional regulator [Candidatus Poribacteria bacterium]
MLNFSEYLRQERLATGLTMQELAGKLLVSPQFISLLENGKRHPSDKLVQRCAKFFGEDLNYLRFLAQPIPDAQKKALFESPSAPDYLPASMRSNVLEQGSDDQLVEDLLTVDALTPPDEDTPYHFAQEVEVKESAFAFQRTLIEQLRANAERFSPKIQAWADFYEAYYLRHLKSRKDAHSKFVALIERLTTQTAEAYPQKLWYLANLHVALGYHETGDLDSARRHYDNARDRAARMQNLDFQTAALWLLSTIHRDKGELLDQLSVLEKALEPQDVPAFGIARCQTDAVGVLLEAWENESVVERAEEAIKLWRSSSLKADQDSKSLHLIRMEIAAFDASLKLDNEDDARSWLSRVRSMRVRIELPSVDEAHLAVTAGSLLSRRGRYTQASKHFREVLTDELPKNDLGNELVHNARIETAKIAIAESRLADAELALEQADKGKTLGTPIRELSRKLSLANAWATLYHAQGATQKRDDAIEDAEKVLKEAIKDDQRIGGLGIARHYLNLFSDWKKRAKE